MTYNKETLKEAIVQKLRLNYGCTEQQATDGEMMKACAMVLRDIMAEHGVQTREETAHEEKRKVHYLSLEFLMGRSLMKNAFNLALLEPLTAAIGELGFKAADIFDMEPDAGLGNGGLGRLAACYLDSMTTLEIPATATPSAMSWAFSSRRSWRASRWSCPTTGCSWATRGCCPSCRRPRRSASAARSAPAGTTTT